MHMKKIITVILLLLFISGCDNEPVDTEDKITLDNVNIVCNALPSGAYNAVQFTSQNIAYTITNKGKIYKTEDGGYTWISQNSDTEMPLTQILFLDDLNGYVTGFNGETNEGIILKTTDGGNTWISQNFQVELYAICFINNMTGYVTGQKLYKTADGVETWSEVDLGYPDYSSINFYDDKKTGFLIAGNLTAGYVVLKTSDGGNDWSVVDNEWGTSTIGEIQILDDINIAFISSQGGKIFKTRDRGNTWQTINSTYSGNFINERQAVGVGQYWPDLGFFSYGVIFITNNGGKDWEQKTVGEFYTVLGIDFSNDSTAVAVGQTNGGCVIHLDF